ncbi:Lyase [Dictyocaulus viviparus]|uniref:Lyase n=1 Tax=Dictyocaulus viviparus TaxID=29172 RepID=A0A0D8XSC4_DICVI|nr:Lyase [Dictyocaulus viviparus]
MCLSYLTIAYENDRHLWAFQTILWRQLWIWLAESQLELGLKQITPEAIEEMVKMRDNIDWHKIREEEYRLKHDVMAHNHAFGAICPQAAGIIHLGATSCYVQDNADIIVIRDCVRYILRRTAIVLDRMARFAEREKSRVTVGRTHYQTASLVTVGKRTVLWAQELLMAFKQLERFHDTMKFRGVKGATGTQDSFLTLFSGDEEMVHLVHFHVSQLCFFLVLFQVEKLDELVTRKAGFDQKFFITGQTYSRQQDVQLIFALAAIGAAVKKICTDIRILQAVGELLEPFEKDQIGSSAMPYKRNPMKSERCCSLARKLIHTPQEALSILSDQGCERTLDDSAGRRMLLPESLLTAEAMLTTLQNVFEGLTVQVENVARIVKEELPFLGLEKAMMWLTEEGVDRQQAHAVIRTTALEAKQKQTLGFVSMSDVLQDSFFNSVRDRVMALVDEPILFTGRCVSQTVRFITNELRPAIEPYFDSSAPEVLLNV